MKSKNHKMKGDHMMTDKEMKKMMGKKIVAVKKGKK